MRRGAAGAELDEGRGPAQEGLGGRGKELGLYLQREAIAKGLRQGSNSEICALEMVRRAGGSLETRGPIVGGHCRPAQTFQGLHQHWGGCQDEGRPSLGLTLHCPGSVDG